MLMSDYWKSRVEAALWPALRNTKPMFDPAEPQTRSVSVNEKLEMRCHESDRLAITTGTDASLQDGPT